MNFLEALQTKDAITYNGAVTHSTSMNACVDLFFISGASRNIKEQDIINLFVKAYSENAEISMKILFWARDCRGGAGERRFFRVCYKYFLLNYCKNIKFDIRHKLDVLIPEYGYWKDIVVLEIISPMVQALKDGNSLAAKWCPRDGVYAEMVRSELKMSPKGFRKLLVGLSNTVEQKMCARQWDEINYKQVPSLAFNNYKKAYERHDTSRFNSFVELVQEGKTSVHSGQLFPYQLYQAFKRNERSDIIDAQWKALPDYLTENSLRMMPVCDVSGSMTGDYGDKRDIYPIDISVSLGVYLSERNQGPFKDAFITFSTNPKLQVLKGTVTERFRQLEKADWQQGTDIQAVFALILAKGLENNIPANQMPNCIIIISDMEFNQCAINTNYEGVKNMYAKYGYELPKIVFWNVNGRVGNVPAKADTKDVALVSGASPAIVKSVLSGKDMTPIAVMLETVTSERYAQITLN